MRIELRALSTTAAVPARRAETLTWFDKHVKNTTPRTTAD
jgi:hypothetical protein